MLAPPLAPPALGELWMTGMARGCQCPEPLTSVAVLQDPKEILLTGHGAYFNTSLAIGCVLLCMLLFVLVVFVWRLEDARRRGLRWSHRRRRISLLSLMQLVTQVCDHGCGDAVSMRRPYCVQACADMCARVCMREKKK